jgi:hypothetical protein
MELPERERRLVANGINWRGPPVQWRSVVVESVAAARRGPAGSQRESGTKEIRSTSRASFSGIEARGVSRESCRAD